MPSGGARPRSGPPPDPRSGRSDARGISAELRVLPAAARGGGGGPGARARRPAPRRGHGRPATPGSAPYGKRYGGFLRLWRGLARNGVG